MYTTLVHYDNQLYTGTHKEKYILINCSFVLYIMSLLCIYYSPCTNHHVLYNSLWHMFIVKHDKAISNKKKQMGNVTNVYGNSPSSNRTAAQLRLYKGLVIKFTLKLEAQSC